MDSKRLTSLTVAAFWLIHPLVAFSQQAQQTAVPQHLPWDWPGHWHMWNGAWAFWWIFPLCMFFLFIVCAAIFLFSHRRRGGGFHHWGPWWMMDRQFGPGHPWGDPTHSAMQILNERYAKGEIQKQEYEEKKAAILSNVQR